MFTQTLINKQSIKAFFLIAGVSILSMFLSNISFIKIFSLSPLILAILFGFFLSNIVDFKINTKYQKALHFCTKEILRFAIILYGFRLTFQDIVQVGFEGFFASSFIVISTFLLGVFIGIKVLKLDKELVMLISAGSSICGAAAVLATEGVLKNSAYKSAIAVSTVVLFGTISMFLYPYLYSLDILNLVPEKMAIYIGATLHEVAHVVGAANSIGGEIIPVEAVVVKMIRVMLIAPFLIVLSFYLQKDSKDKTKKITIPWFAIFFIFVAIFNSFDFLDKELVANINSFDTFLLCMAMFTLGLGTKIKDFKKVGMKPIILASILFVWLLLGGFFIVNIF